MVLLNAARTLREKFWGGVPIEIGRPLLWKPVDSVVLVIGTARGRALQSRESAALGNRKSSTRNAIDATVRRNLTK